MLRGVLLLSLLATGCSAFRVEAGLGPGVGADVHLSGLIHAGVLGGLHLMTGMVYGERVDAVSAVLTFPPFHFQVVGEPGHGFDFYYKHSNFTLLPPLTQGILMGEVRSRPWAFEVTVGLVLVMFRIGVDPIGACLEPDPDPR